MTTFHKTVIGSQVEVFDRGWKADARGKLIEVFRNDDDIFNGDFGQAYVTTIRPGIVKAWHMHHLQTDRMMLLKGMVRFGCVMDAEDGKLAEPVLDMVVTDENPKVIVIPPKIWHGFQNIGDTEAYVLNIPTKEYNRKAPDEDRQEPRYFANFCWTDKVYWG